MGGEALRGRRDCLGRGEARRIEFGHRRDTQDTCKTPRVEAHTSLSSPSPLLACRASPPDPRFALPAQTEAPTDDIVFAVVKGLLEFIEKNPGKSDEWKSKADALQAEGWSVDN